MPIQLTRNRNRISNLQLHCGTILIQMRKV